MARIIPSRRTFQYIPSERTARRTKATVRAAFAATTASLLLVAPLAACGSGTAANSANGQVYFLNSKSENITEFQELAEAFTDETGIPVTVSTGGAVSYDTALPSELAKSNPPTMFSVVGYATYFKVKDYLAPLQDTELYGLLTEDGKSAAMGDGDNVYSIPYVTEYNGILYNKKIIADYCAKDYAVIGSADDITDFDTLKSVVESIQQHKDDLGLDGAWTTPNLDSSGSYRYGDHMARLPISAELRDDNITFKPEITGKYVAQFKEMFDLQANNNPESKMMISSFPLDDSTSQFALGRVAFYNNGTWIYSQLKDNEIAPGDIGVLPYWIGVPGEEDYGAMAVYDAQWGLNKNASEKDRQAALKFMKWMISSDKGKEVISKEMDYSAPFTTFGADDQPTNEVAIGAEALAKQGKKYIYNVGLPNQQFKDNIVNALVEYVQGTGDWSGVESAFVDGWKTEWGHVKETQGMLPDAKPLE
ncbi:ABC transporter substrate-binding protein [Bifidobacterium aerophilum]|uniref:Extracellular solute-binding protein n=1 Tax=Bifidobacterium aerophilum TaxID=1798155 RepID=A0A6N9Z6N8_9BIFI|nr:ABC transporter substrate-binding protein [Bifidobacterium aerophilum]NEG90024.1 extracellular solute-binding protein [Bifidobacterium aerophilum]